MSNLNRYQDFSHWWKISIFNLPR